MATFIAGIGWVDDSFRKIDAADAPADFSEAGVDAEGHVTTNEDDFVEHPARIAYDEYEAPVYNPDEPPTFSYGSDNVSQEELQALLQANADEFAQASAEADEYRLANGWYYGDDGRIRDPSGSATGPNGQDWGPLAGAPAVQEKYGYDSTSGQSDPYEDGIYDPSSTADGGAYTTNPADPPRLAEATNQQSSQRDALEALADFYGDNITADQLEAGVNANRQALQDAAQPPTTGHLPIGDTINPDDPVFGPPAPPTSPWNPNPTPPPSPWNPDPPTGDDPGNGSGPNTPGDWVIGRSPFDPDDAVPTPPGLPGIPGNPFPIPEDQKARQFKPYGEPVGAFSQVRSYGGLPRSTGPWGEPGGYYGGNPFTTPPPNYSPGFPNPGLEPGPGGSQPSPSPVPWPLPEPNIDGSFPPAPPPNEAGANLNTSLALQQAIAAALGGAYGP